MIGPAHRRRLIGRSVFIGLALLLLFARLLPISPGHVATPGPDLLLCLTLAWVLRRPDQVPVLLIAATILLEDVLLMRPVGLWAAVVVMGSEAARAREARWREQPFMVEWLRVALLLAAMMLGCRLAMALFLVPQPPLGQVALHLLATVAAYPPVVLAAHLLGLRRPAPGEGEAVGY
ncbi:rod shape-determining protein MreD [Paracoccus sp. S-4012]|uniref:rod shape-determining protein MreD n=1 Tax=Paracoccus sp. S-4012 TaxID=2665648 RepID=UPI0012AF98B6|nr:rod shape-determining protein MreD [Paracoccus sp. S-4012]MRX49594.1 rod shape-determining protein MreD [Paracoccus sp. S-4012]